jgi:hypothetical protein
VLLRGELVRRGELGLAVAMKPSLQSADAVGVADGGVCVCVRVVSGMNCSRVVNVHIAIFLSRGRNLTVG